MAFSRIVTAGDGSTTQYAINFTLGFLSRDHVTCQVGGEVDGFGDPVYRTLTWISDGLVDVGGTVPALAEEIIFQRTTPKDTLWHDYSNGVPVEELNLDESNLQNLMITHEALDGRFAALAGNLDMGNFKIVNLSDGTLSTDSVTLAQVTTLIGIASGLSGAFPASGISYDNTVSGLTAVEVQAAIDEIDSALDAVAIDVAASKLITDIVKTAASRVALFKLL